MNAGASVVATLNTVSNALFAFAFAPVAVLPAWLSLTLISAVLGVVIFVIFMFTANRKAFSAVVDAIAASILAVFLFRDNIAVTMRSEARLLVCSVKLLWHSLFPVLVMSVPLIFVLAQMAAWYQYRPPVPGSETVLVTMQLQEPSGQWPEVSLKDSAAVGVMTGPVRLFSRAEVYWEIKPLQPGDHELIFRVGDQEYVKTFGAGEGFMRLNPKRSSGWADLLLFPLEKPLPGESLVRSIQVDYPARPSRLYGTDWWILYFCIASMVFALLSKPFIKIRA
ncbi:MAG: hypothetical protein FJ119_09995 [Deltaproteobacteria bacterium]|nr:hypothetical protein [Deltaproteobacteria bacterium]